MPHRKADSNEILVVAPLGRDGALIVEALGRHGQNAVVVSASALAMRMADAAAAVVTEESLSKDNVTAVCAALDEQPPWSDFPMVLLSAPAAVPLGVRHVDNLLSQANVTVLDRPLRSRMLLSAVDAAVRARRRQYQARRAIDQRDQFLAMLGHELRNPLGAIHFASENLIRAASPERHARHIEIIARQTKHLSRLVDDLLDVSRVTSGKVVLERQRVELASLLQRSLQSLDASAQRREISMTLEIDEGASSVFIDGDPVRLEQIVTNLIANAVKYTGKNGRIRVTLRRSEEGIAELRVIDTGIGIAGDMLDRIFEVFEQVDATLERVEGGMGLGLALVKSLVALHGGTVKATSEGIGKGSTFTVCLPTARPQVNEGEMTAPPLGGTRKRVVIVEDNKDIREELLEYLAEEGHQVEGAADGVSGVALICNRLPDIAIVDIGLPGLDGYEVARAVRSKGVQVRLVAVTGYGRPEDKTRALTAGFDDHVRKPMNLETLDRVLGFN